MLNTQAITLNLISLLESQREQTQNEIRNYPPPIPACDAQFNYLLEKRDRLSIELNRLRQLSQDDDIAEGLNHFMAQSTVLNEETKKQFRQQVEASQD